ncbi:hypothetical protein B7P43_G16276 [Cryptotermes secundus]|uniref:DNA polymerase alpha subunit B n=1 Tax=Cryptotermes secundus TaxID=105785 RepID=A0A2J7QE52_9NEOP|nr:DNA polymerase alpha subunit B isoform X3 [Cryptotermes secundus]PNF26857.1 hypothetical protein B7P43_G16276 [Cryptotermes secundus]
MVRREALKEQFSLLGVNNVSEEVIDKCAEICISNGIDEEELVEVWMAFSVSHLRGADPTLDTLVQMERREFSKKQELQPQPQKQSTRSQENSLVIYLGKESTEPDDGDDILDAYSSTPKAKNRDGKKDEHTPDAGPGRGRSPRAIFSPASFSPTAATPSSKYRARTNKGDAVCVYGEKCETDWHPQNSHFQPLVQLASSHMQANTCFMFNQMRDMAQVLNETVHHVGQMILKKFALQEPQAINQPHQNQFVGVGRVCCDSNGRLNAKSLILESFSGKTVPMDVSQVESFSLFPGQVIAVEGENPLGSKLSAKQIYTDTSLPLPQRPSLSSEENGPIQIVVAAGPFTQSDTLTYQPLEDLVEYIQEHSPHLVILIGPFIDATHPHVIEGILAETFQAFFERIVDGIMQPLETVQLSLDRLGRIAGHILSQQSFYPLYPPAEEMNLDLELWANYAVLEVTPHILILPSDLRCFVKNLNGCVIVNPERLAKGLVGGNFARLEVSCAKGDVNVNAQIVKI